jgi:predicted transcriptional regulator
MKSSTSSFRISERLRLRLDRLARHSRRGKNQIINRALEEHLAREEAHSLAAEAWRQSLAVRGSAAEEDNFWNHLADTEGWK